MLDDSSKLDIMLIRGDYMEDILLIIAKTKIISLITKRSVQEIQALNRSDMAKYEKVFFLYPQNYRNN